MKAIFQQILHSRRTRHGNYLSVSGICMYKCHQRSCTPIGHYNMHILSAVGRKLETPHTDNAAVWQRLWGAQHKRIYKLPISIKYVEWLQMWMTVWMNTGIVGWVICCMNGLPRMYATLFIAQRKCWKHNLLSLAKTCFVIANGAT